MRFINTFMSLKKSPVYILFVALLISGCAANSLIRNTAIDKTGRDNSYSLKAFQKSFSRPNNSLLLAFSGGGTRAAALSYGVLQELRDTIVADNIGHNDAAPRNKNYRLLDDVGFISSVSGGSFTAAYYGIHGDKIFTDFEDVFLKKDIESPLLNYTLSPLNWFNKINRSEYAINYYEEEVFKGATFADMLRPNAPMVLINATDLTHSVRFTFIQEYFDLLCSDLKSFSVSRAVAASSAVPLLFPPIVVENFTDCLNGTPDWLKSAQFLAQDDHDLALTVSGLEGYLDKKNHQFSHFIDGGISDNLGLRSISDISRISGGVNAMLERYKIDLASRLVIISVDASTEPQTWIGESSAPPSVANIINTMSDIQLQRYNSATNIEMKRSLDELVQNSDTVKALETYFIRLNFSQIKNSDTKYLINQIPTSLTLSDQEVDMVIKAGGDLLRENSEFQRLLNDITKVKIKNNFQRDGKRNQK
jgi:NTE family protein